jgi:hypothetical protein
MKMPNIGSVLRFSSVNFVLFALTNVGEVINSTIVKILESEIIGHSYRGFVIAKSTIKSLLAIKSHAEGRGAL